MECMDNLFAANLQHVQESRVSHRWVCVPSPPSSCTHLTRTSAPSLRPFLSILHHVREQHENRNPSPAFVSFQSYLSQPKYRHARTFYQYLGYKIVIFYVCRQAVPCSGQFSVFEGRIIGSYLEWQQSLARSTQWPPSILAAAQRLPAM